MSQVEEFLEAEKKKLEEADRKRAEEAALKTIEPPDFEEDEPQSSPTELPKKDIAPKKEELPKPTGEKDWKVEHDKMYGTMSNTIAGLRREIESLKGMATESETLRKENAELKAKVTAPVKPAVENDEDMEALRQEFGEEAVNRLIRHNRRMTEEMIRDILGPVTEEVGALKTGITKSAVQLYDEKLLSQMPDAYEIGDSPEFAAWLEENDWLDVFKTAHASHNVNKVLDKLAKYKATLTPVSDPAADEEKAEKERLLAEQAAGPGAGRGAKQPIPDKKTYTKAEYNAFTKEYVSPGHGKYGSNPRFRAIYDDMMKALDEGRISP